HFRAGASAGRVRRDVQGRSPLRRGRRDHGGKPSPEERGPGRSMTRRFVLDTDVLTLYQRGNPNVVRNVQSHPLDVLAVTIISVEEQLSGWYTELRRAKKTAQLAQVYERMTDAVRFFIRFHILTFAEPAIVRYEGLRATHRRLDKDDLRIA